MAESDTATEVPPRDDGGKFVADGKAEQILDEMAPGEPYSAGELADKTGIPRTTVHFHLDRLAEAGEVLKKQIHPRRVNWRVPVSGCSAE